MSRNYNFTIDTAVAPAHMDEILDFIYNFYLLPKQRNFQDINLVNGKSNSELSFFVTDPEKGWRIFVLIESGAPLEVDIKSFESTPEEFITDVKKRYSYLQYSSSMKTSASPHFTLHGLRVRI